ncbi:SsrA-binding protein [Poriferisphaera corsica]|uniref:SsrA-binding protein n=1 Tax=Poriferisphaera corsica TaxID=2528020 RepID=A0A517YVH3_9BACT|nr:SsrA-binding protein SmpB [Poriferisphaera corsica]QDU34172.1 SsrA-binding protein [Poriferisphaera corsica]
MAKKHKKKHKNESQTRRIVNRRAYHDYHISDKLECGISLQGSEVKSIRDGQASIAEGYATVDEKELLLKLVNCEISKYPHAGVHQHEPKRVRTLLAHKKQIKQLANKTREKGVTIVPLAMYFTSRGIVKIEIGLGRGKRAHDKRHDIKERDADRSIRRAMTKRHL